MGSRSDTSGKLPFSIDADKVVHVVNRVFDVSSRHVQRILDEQSKGERAPVFHVQDGTTQANSIVGDWFAYSRQTVARTAERRETFAQNYGGQTIKLI